MKDGAPLAELVEHLGDLELVDLVDGDVPHRLQRPGRPDRPREGLDASTFGVEQG
jgi:hypothetical protein